MDSNDKNGKDSDCEDNDDGSDKHGKGSDTEDRNDGTDEDRKTGMVRTMMTLPIGMEKTVTTVLMRMEQTGMIKKVKKKMMMTTKEMSSYPSWR